MQWQFSQFHFLRPEWLILLPFVVALWWFIRKASAHQQWRQYFPQVMLEALQVNGTQRSNVWHWWLLISWLLLTLAMSGPTWIKQPVPVVKNQNAIVIALDLSPSMYADDLAPNRLIRARFKIIDILNKQEDGQMALIAYAGDAHTVSPLTDDPKSIEVLLPALSPDIMPSSGSNIEAAITLAQTLLKDSGISSGEILVLTDGMTTDAIRNVKRIVNSTNRLSILGVGGSEASPVKSSDGRLLRDNSGNIILAEVNRNELRELANSLNGNYSDLTSSDLDINRLLTDNFNSDDSAQALDDDSFDAWQDLAHWLALLILPLALLCFRKGVIYLIPIIIFMPLDSNAQELSLLDKIFKNKDQQAYELYQQEDYEGAAKTFENPNWSAISKYKNGEFNQATTLLDQDTNSTSSLYNKGNALAMSGKLEEAIEAYDQTIKINPDHEDALHNKKIVEELLKQQQNNQQQQSDQQQSDQQQSDQQQSEQQQAEQQQAEQQQAEQQQAEQQQAEQEQAEQEQAEQEQAEQEQAEQQQAEADSDKENEEESDSTALVESDKTPLKDSSEQWLRTIQDDPSFFLRRKFEHQSQQRQDTNRSQQNRY